MTAGGGPGSRRSPEHRPHEWPRPSPEGLSACSRCGLLSRLFPDGSRMTYGEPGDRGAAHGGGGCDLVILSAVMES